MITNETYHEYLRRVYNDSSIAEHIDRLRAEGYKVDAWTEGCQIYGKTGDLLIDADFYDNDYFMNAACAIDGFSQLKNK
jgi:hypothetical protein